MACRRAVSSQHTRSKSNTCSGASPIVESRKLSHAPSQAGWSTTIRRSRARAMAASAAHDAGTPLRAGRSRLIPCRASAPGSQSAVCQIPSGLMSRLPVSLSDTDQPTSMGYECMLKPDASRSRNRRSHPGSWCTLVHPLARQHSLETPVCPHEAPAKQED